MRRAPHEGQNPRLLAAVGGIGLPIDRIEGKLKASQDEAMEDRRGTVHGLRQTGGAEAAAMADWVAQAIARDAAATGDTGDDA